MPSVLAIISKEQFESAARAAGDVTLGASLRLHTYSSYHRGLDVLGRRDALFLVTVRKERGHERLWLVAILEDPKKVREGWRSAPSDQVIADVTEVRKQLRFASGTGLKVAAGKLAMSLQTPRALSPEDVTLLRDAAARATSPESKRAREAVAPALEPAPAPPPAEGEQGLLGAVYSDPVADGPRLVFADWLLERNDPRGEVIELACREQKASPAQKKKARELEAMFGGRWLGSLEGKVVSDGLRFDRGFVSSAVVSAEMDEDPAWGTLHELRTAAPPMTVPMPLLTKLSHLGNRDILRLAKRKLPLNVEVLSWEGPELPYTAHAFDAPGREAVKAFEAITCLPKLKRLELFGQHAWPADHWVPSSTNGISADMLRWAWQAPCCATLEELLFPAPPRNLPGFLEALGPTSVKRVVLSTAANGSYALGEKMIVTRDEKGALTELELRLPDTGPHNLGRFVQELDALPRTLFTRAKALVSKRLWSGFNGKRALKKALEGQRNLKECDIKPVDSVGQP
jgi:uncharacterized protein (TIGR02996 family)